MPVIAHGGDPDKAEREQREFYELLGRAISQWAEVETGIYHTYRRVTDPGDWVAAAAGFHSIVNSNTKLEMIEAAISTSRRYSSQAEAWAKLHKKIRKNSARRAKLAHWTVLQKVFRGDGTSMCLMSPIYDFGRHTEEGAPEEIGAKQIAEWSGAFVRLAKDVDAFWRQLSWLQTPP